jgi:hypothetical protein
MPSPFTSPSSLPHHLIVVLALVEIPLVALRLRKRLGFLVLEVGESHHHAAHILVPSLACTLGADTPLD